MEFHALYFAFQQEGDMIMNREQILTDPKKLVKLELQKAGFDLATIEVPKRVFLLADNAFDTMLSKRMGTSQYPLGGDLFGQIICSDYII